MVVAVDVAVGCEDGRKKLAVSSSVCPADGVMVIVGFCECIIGSWLDHRIEECRWKRERSPSAVSGLRPDLGSSISELKRLIRTILESTNCITMFRMIFSLAIRILFGKSPGSGKSQSRTRES